jgi:hypothetical protein
LVKVLDVGRDRRRIEHVAEVDGEDRGDDQPGLDIVAEQLDADHLAGAGIDGSAHEGQFEQRHAVIGSQRAEQRAERGGGQCDGKAAAQAVDKIRATHRRSFLLEFSNFL